MTVYLETIDLFDMGNFNFSNIYFGEEGYSGQQTYSYNSSIYNYSDFEKSSDIKYSMFNGNTTSNFTNASSVENLTLEIIDTGKIAFKEILNLTSGADFNSYVIIAKKFISVNSSALPELNKSATLQFEGLIGDGYVVYRNGVVCLEAYCSNFSYSGGVLSFDVSGFSNYSVEETFDAPVIVDDDGGSSGGGGGGGGSPAVVLNESEEINETVANVTQDGGERIGEAMDSGIEEVVEDEGGFSGWVFGLVGICAMGLLLYKKNKEYRFFKKFKQQFQ